MVANAEGMGATAEAGPARTAESNGQVATTEPYRALYRRYRPQRFSEVRGQDHVTRALLNAVREGRVAHAYLFSGPRGTGKTSTARILAMALNCEFPEAGEPDGTCPSCLSIRSGASMDVFELDAASNRKLDEMRDLLSRVALGTPGRWKVYIIDEVHQLTSDAASALLKTLEDPPGHVVFVLATTDPQRVLPTILSRTQHFEFRLFSNDALTRLVEDVNQMAGLGLPDETLRAAVRRARGSARDALSALDQFAAAGGEHDEGGNIAEVVEALAERDAGRALQAVGQAIAAGREPRRIGNDLVEHLRNSFLALQAPSLVALAGISASQLGEQGRRMGLALLVRAMELVGQALVDMRESVDPRVTLEVTLIRCASPGADTSPAALLERIERLEARIMESAPPVPRPPAAVQAKSAAPQADPQQGVSVQGEPLASGEGSAATSLQGGLTGPEQGGLTGREQVGLTGREQVGLTGREQVGLTGPAQARVALGALLRDKAAGIPLGGSVVNVSATPPRQPTLEPSIVTERGAAPASAADVSAGPAAGLPSRDELTKAWGDVVLARLSRAARAFLSNGRFVESVSPGASFALPDRGLLERALHYLAEAQEGLSAHFGRAVPLQLVLDRGAGVPPEPVALPVSQASPDDLDDLTEAQPALPAEQRLLQAFPGSSLDE